jgi:perosamine synthetase
MIFVPPKSRFRLYGTPGHYVSVARDLVLGRATSGTAVDDLEKEIAAYLGVAEAICMPQARIGLYVTLQSLIKPGQNVVLSPYTIHDVINMVIAAGGRPVFADIDRETCNISAREVKALVDAGTGAVIATHLHGCACDIEEIAGFCRDKNVPLIEDAAQAFGARVGARRLGTFGRAGVFSFGMAKNVNSFYGGLVVTDDRALALRIRSAMQARPFQDTPRLFNRIAFCLVGDVLTSRAVFDGLTFWVYRYGHLHGIDAITDRWRGEDEPLLRREVTERQLRRMTPMQARLVLRSLSHVDEETRIRTDYARRYQEGLRDVPEVLLPPFREDGSHIYLSYPIQVSDREGLQRFLIRNGRDLAVQHIGNTADYSCFAEYRRDCPNARLTAGQVLLLPTYPRYGNAEVDRNIRLIRRFYRESHPRLQ